MNRSPTVVSQTNTRRLICHRVHPLRLCEIFACLTEKNKNKSVNNRHDDWG